MAACGFASASGHVRRDQLWSADEIKVPRGHLIRSTWRTGYCHFVVISGHCVSLRACFRDCRLARSFGFILSLALDFVLRLAVENPRRLRFDAGDTRSDRPDRADDRQRNTYCAES